MEKEEATIEPKGEWKRDASRTASGLPMTVATVLEASARMEEVSTPSRFTFVDTFRQGILARFRFLSCSSFLSWLRLFRPLNLSTMRSD